MKSPPLSQPEPVPAMDIKHLTDAMHRLVESKGWYAPDSKRPQTPRNLAVSLSIEAAEVLEHFQFTEEIRDRDELASELADVTLYLLQLASVSGIDLEQAVLKKIEVNQSREWDVEK
jgi:NTP pyrophosphatase (non-canonical NTP hydrolase)